MDFTQRHMCPEQSSSTIIFVCTFQNSFTFLLKAISIRRHLTENYVICVSSNSVHRLKRQTNGQEITTNSIVNVNEFANGLTNIDVTRVVSTGCKTL